MRNVVQVLGIAVVAAVITGVGAVLAELVTLPNRVVSGALQLAAGVLAAIVVVELLPPAARSLHFTWVVLAFFLGSALFLAFDYASAWHTARRGEDAAAGSAGLVVGIVGDFLIDGIVIGIGAAALGLADGLLLAIGMAVAQAPLAFVADAAAKGRGMPAKRRRGMLGMCLAVVVVGVMLGFLVLRNQPDSVNLTLIAGSAGFLLTAVTQVMVPEAIGFLGRKGPSLTPVWFTVGMAGMSLLKLAGT